MDCGQTFSFAEGELDCADVRDLLAHHFAEMRTDSPPEACHVLPIEGLRDPRIIFVSLRDETGRLLGVGALKKIGDAHAEVKSMRTAPGALGRGVGRKILGHLISVARDAGCSKLSLETGNSRLFDAANRLYASAGFERCGPFGDYVETPFTHFYTRAI